MRRQFSPETIRTVDTLRNTHLAERSHGAAIPSESILSKQLGIGRSTVRNALKYLVETQEVYALHGSGYYVNFGERRKLKVTEQLVSLSEYVDGTEIVQKPELVKAEPISTLLGLRKNENMINLRTQRYFLANGEKYVSVYSDHFIRPDRYSKVSIDRYVAKHASISGLYEHLGIEWLRHWTRMKVRNCSMQDLQMMSIGEYDSVIETLGLNVTPKGEPIEVTISNWPSHIWTLEA